MSSFTNEIQNEKWIRLQVKGGADFNIVLPANPKWKITELEEQILKNYNQIASAEGTSQAASIKSITRKGHYIANNLRVGQVFDDWDEIQCRISLSGGAAKEKGVLEFLAEKINSGKDQQKEKQRQRPKQKQKEKDSTPSNPKEENKKKKEEPEGFLSHLSRTINEVKQKSKEKFKKADQKDSKKAKVILAQQSSD